MDLDSMKYTELRSLAKELGLKANMKADKLLKAIKQHYQEEKNKEAKEQGQDINDEAQEKSEVVLDSSCKEEVSSTTGFVNTRRGKGKGNKRKISDTATLTKSDAKMPPVAAKDDTEVDALTAPCNARGGKKRKVSSTNDKEKNEPPKKIQTADHEEQQLQPAIKDEAPVTAETGLCPKKAPKGAKAGRIPRLQQKSKPLLKPVTPNFKKLHEAHFNKMESIDSYVQRKTKQMETYRNSVKELKSLSDKTKLLQVDGKAQVRANPTRASMFSPAPVNKTPGGENRRHTVLSATKKPLAKEVTSFRPSVLSTRRINVRFSEATHDNEYKRSLVKTPARMSPCVASSTPEKQTANGFKPSSVKTASFSATKTPGQGPFVFTGNTSTSTTPGTNKKPSFDLKASLSRPLTYKPHKGKLKPFEDVKENTAMNKSISNPHQEAYKQHKVQSREGRRAKQIQDRKQKKESMLGARRGLVMA